MSKVKVYNSEGKVVGEQELNPKIFGVKINPSVIKDVVVAIQANSRQITADTQGRGEVRGGGKKPWRQKGTGRARHGSSRSPIWKGGGVTFGPTSDRNFTLKVNKKVKKQAILMTLTDKAASEGIILIDKLELPEIKTKTLSTVLKNLELQDAKNNKSVLIVTEGKDEKVKKSAANIEKVATLSASSLNVLDVLKYQALVLPVAALKTIEETFLAK